MVRAVWFWTYLVALHRHTYCILLRLRGDGGYSRTIIHLRASKDINGSNDKRVPDVMRYTWSRFVSVAVLSCGADFAWAQGWTFPYPAGGDSCAGGWTGNAAGGCCSYYEAWGNDEDWASHQTHVYRTRCDSACNSAAPRRARASRAQSVAARLGLWHRVSTP